MIQDSSLYRSILRDWILISRFSYHPTVIQDERSSKKELILKNVSFHTGENRRRERERESVSHSRFLISVELVLSLMAKVSSRSWKLVLNSTVFKVPLLRTNPSNSLKSNVFHGPLLPKNLFHIHPDFISSMSILIFHLFPAPFLFSF